SSSSASLWVGALRVEISMSLARCETSSAVIGSPLTSATTCWARAGAGRTATVTIAVRAAAMRHLRDVGSLGIALLRTFGLAWYRPLGCGSWQYSVEADLLRTGTR